MNRAAAERLMNSFAARKPELATYRTTELIWQPDRSLLDSKTHHLIKVRFNLERKHDNVDPRFAELLNRLWKLRERARYLASEVELTEAEMDETLAAAEEMHEVLVATSPRRAPVSS